MMRVPFLLPGYFFWIIAPIAVYAIYLVYGLPHFIWNYSWKNDGQGYDPFVNRTYARCTYIGPYGEFAIRHPADGKCGWVRFYKKSGRPSSAQTSGRLSSGRPSLMGFDDFQMRCGRTAWELVSFRKLHGCHVFQNGQKVFHGHRSHAQRIVAFITAVNHQTIGSHLVPEILISERFKPVLDILYISELSHDFRIPEIRSDHQELSAWEYR